MKNLLAFSCIVLSLMSIKTKAQIFATSSTNQSITITPAGISGKTASPTLPTNNTALGEDALSMATTAIYNTAIGYKTLSNVTVTPIGQSFGSFNTAVGSLALQNNTTGFYNSALGYLALTANTTGYNNAAMGVSALSSNTSGSHNSAFGTNALKSNSTVSDIAGNYNAAFGTNALAKNTNGSANSAFGGNAMASNITGGGNSAFGYNSLSANLTGQYNSAVGVNALQANTATGNSAVGANALTSNTGGLNNAAVGYQAMYSNQSGSDNVGVGKNALYSNVSGLNNVALGESALNNTIGSGNVGIGYHAGLNETGSNRLYIDNTSTAAPLIGGDFSNNKVTINRNLTTNGATDFVNRTEVFQVEGEAFKTLGSGNWTFPSDRRLKANIVSLNSQEMLKKVLRMQGVTYELKASPERGKQYGFIAQDLREIFPEKITENKAGYLSASYGDFDPMIVESIKALHDKIVKLESENEQLRNLNARLDALNEKLVKKITDK
jgi:hypothetical protein